MSAESELNVVFAYCSKLPRQIHGAGMNIPSPHPVGTRGVCTGEGCGRQCSKQVVVLKNYSEGSEGSGAVWDPVVEVTPIDEDKPTIV